MVWFDFIIVGIVAISVMVSIVRGFIREALSLVAWILSLFGAVKAVPFVLPLFVKFVDSKYLSVVLAFSASFILLLVILSLLNMFFVKMLRRTGLREADRSLGALFGVARGAMVVVIVVLLTEMTPAKQSLWWKESYFVPYFRQASVYVLGLMPEKISEQLKG